MNWKSIEEGFMAGAYPGYYWGIKQGGDSHLWWLVLGKYSSDGGVESMWCCPSQYADLDQAKKMAAWMMESIAVEDITMAPAPSSLRSPTKH